MPWRTSKGWKSEKAQAQDRALNKACQPPRHRKAPIVPQAQLSTALLCSSFSPSPEALQAILTHSSSQSHSFVVFSQPKRLKQPQLSNHSQTLQALHQFSTPSSISVIASSPDPLSHSCTVITPAPLPGKPHPKHIPSLKQHLRHPWSSYLCWENWACLMFFLKRYKSLGRRNNSLKGSVAELGLEIDTNCCDSKQGKTEGVIIPCQS